MINLSKHIIFFCVAVLFTQFNLTGGELQVGKSFQYKSVASAISASVNGDTIIINGGFYKEANLVIREKIILIGKNNPIIDGESRYNILSIFSDSVTVEGITFQNAGISFIEDNAAIKLDSVKHCIIRNNTFINNFFGVYLAEASYCTITGNSISAQSKKETQSGNGIHLWYCKNILIENNSIEGHRDGIYFEFVESSIIKHNFSFENLRYGLHFMFSDSCTYSENRFEDNGAGVAVMFTHRITMVNNEFIHNWGSASFGILLKEITDSKIENNYFYKNTSGIYLEGCNRIIIANNDFIENGWALRLMANSMDNIFRENNFIGNSFDIATNNTKNYNLFEYNYWSEYSGYDINKDGIGDIPYRPVKLFSLIVERNKPTLLLLRSFFAEILNYAERVFPALTPKKLVDNSPAMQRLQ
ncbi:MAG: nitrous oxide reductase family maturation protein NosD [Melioribacteraceae bacterium]|nr:nitrous oxide reductase family maturation protein NosD [Melioribacteraceae bacterium]MCF8354967.1 nitrous oxide reductase family maturation protein NosD [Melioribacteraceae bacterium]MCF8394016.1 nitrous oxide reductase family maturation protein NosD [Melioribacteraceae bacterium]MCF8419781.1 nitrous oxide reductase family maturation protein NosD [Melioribacteraceae bacterium]